MYEGRVGEHSLNLTFAGIHLKLHKSRKPKLNTICHERAVDMKELEREREKKFKIKNNQCGGKCGCVHISVNNSSKAITSIGGRTMEWMNAINRTLCSVHEMCVRAPICNDVIE